MDHYDHPAAPDSRAESSTRHSLMGIIATACAVAAGAAIVLVLYWAYTSPPGERTILGARRASAAAENKALMAALFLAAVGIKLAMKSAAEVNCRGLFQWTALLGNLAVIAAAAAVSTLVIDW